MVRESDAGVEQSAVGLISPSESKRPQILKQQQNSEGARARAAAGAREQPCAGLWRNERIRIVKNVVVLGIAFMLHFTGFFGTANLQSSVNSEGSLGTFTMASIYGSLILSNIFLPVVVIR